MKILARLAACIAAAIPLSASAFSYSGACSDGCAANEPFTHTNANELDAALDTAESEIDTAQTDIQQIQTLIGSDANIITFLTAATPTTDADGEAAIDIDGWGPDHDAFEFFDGTASVRTVAISGSCSNAQVATFNTDGTFTCETPTTGSSAALDLTDDDVDESAGITEIAIVNDGLNIFSEPSPNKLKIDMGSLSSELANLGYVTEEAVVIVGATSLFPNATQISSAAGSALALGTSAGIDTWVSDDTGSGALVFANTPTLVTPILGTPTSGTLTNTTGFPVANLAGLGTGVATFLATPSSANLLSAMTTKTGTGSLVFGTSPTLTTPAIGAATATTPAADDNDTSVATTAFVQGELLQCPITTGTADPDVGPENCLSACHTYIQTLTGQPIAQCWCNPADDNWSCETLTD